VKKRRDIRRLQPASPTGCWPHTRSRLAPRPDFASLVCRANRVPPTLRRTCDISVSHWWARCCPSPTYIRALP